jgi:hypothetical protein
MGAPRGAALAAALDLAHHACSLFSSDSVGGWGWQVGPGASGEGMGPGLARGHDAQNMRWVPGVPPLPPPRRAPGPRGPPTPGPLGALGLQGLTRIRLAEGDLEHTKHGALGGAGRGRRGEGLRAARGGPEAWWRARGRRRGGARGRRRLTTALGPQMKGSATALGGGGGAGRQGRGAGGARHAGSAAGSAQHPVKSSAPQHTPSPPPPPRRPPSPAVRRPQAAVHDRHRRQRLVERRGAPRGQHLGDARQRGGVEDEEDADGDKAPGG